MLTLPTYSHGWHFTNKNTGKKPIFLNNNKMITCLCQKIRTSLHTDSTFVSYRSVIIIKRRRSWNYRSYEIMFAYLSIYDSMIDRKPKNVQVRRMLCKHHYEILSVTYDLFKIKCKVVTESINTSKWVTCWFKLQNAYMQYYTLFDKIIVTVHVS